MSTAPGFFLGLLVAVAFTADLLAAEPAAINKSRFQNDLSETFILVVSNNNVSILPSRLILNNATQPSSAVQRTGKVIPYASMTLQNAAVPAAESVKASPALSKSAFVEEKAKAGGAGLIRPYDKVLNVSADPMLKKPVLRLAPIPSAASISNFDSHTYYLASTVSSNWGGAQQTVLSLQEIKPTKDVKSFTDLVNQLAATHKPLKPYDSKGDDTASPKKINAFMVEAYQNMLPAKAAGENK